MIQSKYNKRGKGAFSGLKEFLNTVGLRLRNHFVAADI